MNIQEILTRLNQQMTDQQIADAIGSRQSVICRLRNGKHKTTSFERGKAIVELAQKNGINIEEFIAAKSD